MSRLAKKELRAGNRCCHQSDGLVLLSSFILEAISQSFSFSFAFSFFLCVKRKFALIFHASLCLSLQFHSHIQENSLSLSLSGILAKRSDHSISLRSSRLVLFLCFPNFPLSIFLFLSRHFIFHDLLFLRESLSSL